MKILFDSYAWLRNPYAFLEQARAMHGLTFRQNLIVPGKCLITGDPKLIETIRNHPGLEAGKTVQGLRTIMGDDSLIMLHGAAHRARRELIAPFFRGESLRSIDGATRRIAAEEFAKMRGVFSAFDVFQRISLRSILRHLLGDLSITDEAQAMERTIAFLGSFRNPAILFARWLQLDLGKYSPWGRAMFRRAELLDFLAKTIRRNKECIAAQIVRRLADDGFEIQTAMNEILALLLFGHDTGAAVLAWTAGHIYSNASALDRVRQTYEEPGSMLLRAENFLHACLLESMRLTPTVVHLTRRCDEPTTIGPWSIAPGIAVIPCMYLAHRDPEIFERPADFLPERFLGASFPAANFFPFGFGDRLCVGMPFVLRHMQLTLGEIIRCAFEIVPLYAMSPERKLVLMLPSRGCLLRVRE